MSTTASIDFFGFQVWISDGGDPESMLPELERMRRGVAERKAVHKLNTRKAALCVLDDYDCFEVERKPGSYELGYYGEPSYKYVVTEKRVEGGWVE